VVSCSRCVWNVTYWWNNSTGVKEGAMLLHTPPMKPHSNERLSMTHYLCCLQRSSVKLRVQKCLQTSCNGKHWSHNQWPKSNVTVAVNNPHIPPPMTFTVQQTITKETYDNVADLPDNMWPISTCSIVSLHKFHTAVAMHITSLFIKYIVRH